MIVELCHNIANITAPFLLQYSFNDCVLVVFRLDIRYRPAVVSCSHWVRQHFGLADKSITFFYMESCHLLFSNIVLNSRTLTGSSIIPYNKYIPLLIGFARMDFLYR